MFEKIESWMVTVGLAIAGAVGWGYRETQINKTQAKQIDKNTNAIKALESKSAERGELMARIDERQASMADTLSDIKELLSDKK